MEAQASILVVDDSPENLQVMAAVLKEQYKVRVAINGERALALATAPEPPDLILLDVMMPGMDGYEVCSRLKSNPATAGIPVLFVSSCDEEEDESLLAARPEIRHFAFNPTHSDASITPAACSTSLSPLPDRFTTTTSFLPNPGANFLTYATA